MPTDTKLKELIINELTEEQYKALTPNDDELYLTPDGSITKNENGSYVLDGDVDITGTTKLNGGIEPIHYYNIQSNPAGYKLIVLFEKYDEINNSYSAFGFIEYVGDSIYPGVFHYSLLNGSVDQFYGVFENKIIDYNGSTVTESVIATLSN